MNYAEDIPLSLAQSAHNGTSFVPETRAAQEQADYANTLQSDYSELAKLATPETADVLETEFARYREGYKRHTLAYLAARSRMVSPMIVGPARFPVHQQQKRGDTAHRRLTELIEFRKRALNAIRKKLCPGLRPIMSGDSDAVERLKTMIAEAEHLRDAMKLANKIIRATPAAKRREELQAAFEGKGFNDEVVSEILKPDFLGRIGWKDYDLKNNNANIRRMKQRLVVIRQNSQVEATKVDGLIARLEDCPADNRVRLFFPGKPDEAIRTRLKSCGFRWTPSIGCWQAYRNSRSIDTAKQVAGV